MKLNYILIPVAALAVALLGGWLTSGGMEWYKTIKLPGFTPAGGIIGTVWTVIFILAAISALIFWNHKPGPENFNLIAALLILNGILNIAWSLIFFRLHLLGPAIFEAGILGLSVFILIILIWPVSRLAAGLLIPYAGWASFATYLTYAVWALNK